jgi:hypothetical protein
MSSREFCTYYGVLDIRKDNKVLDVQKLIPVAIVTGVPLRTVGNDSQAITYFDRILIADLT